MFNTLWEITHDKILMDEQSVRMYSDMIFHNIDLRAQVDAKKQDPCLGFMSFDKQGVQNHMEIEARTLAGDAVCMNDWDLIEDGDEVVNVMKLVGPMTRSGQDCSMGTIQMRDRMKKAANIEQVKAHILYTRTPGGMASCLIDMRDAIDYCHSKGQKVYMLADGDVFSCGTFIGCICDGIYTTSWEFEIGSLGGMMAGFITPEGAENAITKERYVEVYGTRSTDKNHEHREAMKGNLKPMQEDLDKFLDKALAQAKADRPSVRADQLTGKNYRMGDVKGSLVDGKMTLGEMAEYAIKQSKRR